MDKRFEQHFHLTPAEREIIPLLARGDPDGEMAVELGISVSSVRSRLRGFHQKTGTSGRKAVCWAKDHLACCASGP